MKKISIILIILVLFLVSCKDSVFYFNGLALHLETDSYVELLDDGNGNFCIGRVGDYKGIFNDTKINTLLPQLESDLQSNQENYEFAADFDIGWYQDDPYNIIDAIIGDDGVYISLRNDILGTDYDSAKYISVNNSKEIIYNSNKSIKGFVQQIDIGDYVSPMVTKIFVRDENDIFYQVDKNVILYNSENEDSLTVDFIDYLNNNIELNQYDLMDGTKELEYF